MRRYKELATQFAKFSVVGVTNTLVSWAVYYGLLWLGLHYAAANASGFILGVLNSYYWNKKYVFGGAGGRLKTVVKMYAGSTATLMLSMGMIIVQVEYLGVSKYAAQLVNTAVIVWVNFIISKLWVFNE